MLAGRGKRRIRKRWKSNFNGRIPREVTVLRFVEGALEIIDLRADLDAPLQRVAIALRLKRGEFWKRRNRQIDFRDRPHAAIILDFLYEVGSEVRGIDHSHQGALGVGVRDDGSRGNIFTRGEHDAGSNAVLHANLGAVSVGANLRTSLFRRRSHRQSDRPGATGSELNAARWSWICSRAQHQHERTARRPRAEKCSKDAAGGNRGA